MTIAAWMRNVRCRATELFPNGTSGVGACRLKGMWLLLPGVLLLQATSCSTIPVIPFPLSSEGPPPGYISGDIPERYKGMVNPFTPEDRLAVAAGAGMYISFELSCAVCHGVAGRGDGPMVHYLDFAPPSFAGPWLLNALRNHQDYSYWWVAEGVSKTPMPAWKDRMSETEIWQVITYAWYLGERPQQAPAAQGYERAYPRPPFPPESTSRGGRR